jgi:aspartyl-tRNA(Asn)/glutamyl-tRNA(Gln) amidotransferase subunit A
MYLADANTVPVNLANLPAISVPAGETEDGLPVGLQLIGPAFGEHRLVRAASALD